MHPYLVSFLVKLLDHLGLPDAFVLTDIDKNLDSWPHYFGLDHEPGSGRDLIG